MSAPNQACRPETDVGPARGGKAWLLSLVVLALLTLFAGNHLATVPVRLSYPGELNYIEGIPMAEMLHLRQGAPIYAGPSAGNYEVANYGPLYYLLGARLIDPQQPAYLPLRVLSLVATLGCAAGVALLAYWLTRRPLAAPLGSLLFLSFNFVIRHGVSARCDVVALFLSFVGFLIAYRCRTRRALLWAVPLMLGGIYYKQQFIAGPLALTVYLWRENRRRLAAEFAGLMALGGLALLGLFQFVIFPGQTFLRHFVFYNLLPFDLFSFASAARFFAAMLLIPLWMAIRALRVFQDKLLTYYFAFALSLSLLSIGRTGSDTNYFLECGLVVAVLLGAHLARPVEEPARDAGLMVLLMGTLLAGQLIKPHAPTVEDFRRDQNVQQYLRSHFAPGTPALSYYAGDVVRAGLTLPVSDLYLYNQLIVKGTIDGRDLKGLIEKRQFGLILLGFDLQKEGKGPVADFYLTGPIRRSILANYQLKETLAMPLAGRLRLLPLFYVWVPGPPSAAVTPSDDPRNPAQRTN